MVMYLKYLLCSIKTQFTFSKILEIFFFCMARPGFHTVIDVTYNDVQNTFIITYYNGHKQDFFYLWQCAS